MKRIRERLRSRRGETLVEVLIAMLISVIGLLMLAGMIRTAANLVTKSKAQAEAIERAEDGLTKHEVVDNVSSTPGSISTNGVTLYDKNSYDVDYYSTNVGRATVKSYKIKEPQSGAQGDEGNQGEP